MLSPYMCKFLRSYLVLRNENPKTKKEFDWTHWDKWYVVKNPNEITQKCVTNTKYR
jgi:hypothetical protein